MSDISSLLRNGSLSTPEQHQMFVNSVMSSQNSEQYELSEEVFTFDPDINSFIVFAHGPGSTVRLWDLNNLYVALFKVPEVFSEHPCYFETSLKDVKCIGICFSNDALEHAVEFLENIGNTANRTQFLESIVGFNKEHPKKPESPAKKEDDQGRGRRRALKSAREARPIGEDAKSPKRRARSPRRAKSPEAQRKGAAGSPKERTSSSFIESPGRKPLGSGERSNLSVGEVEKVKKRVPNRAKSVRSPKKGRKEESESRDGEHSIVTFDGEDTPKGSDRRPATSDASEKSNVSGDAGGRPKRVLRTRSPGRGRKRQETSHSEQSSLLVEGDDKPGPSPVTERSSVSLSVTEKSNLSLGGTEKSNVSLEGVEKSSVSVDAEKPKRPLRTRSPVRKAKKGSGEKRQEATQNEQIQEEGHGTSTVTERSSLSLDANEKSNVSLGGTERSNVSLGGSEKNSVSTDAEKPKRPVRARSPVKHPRKDESGSANEHGSAANADEKAKESEPSSPSGKQKRQPLRLSPHERPELVLDENGQVQRRVVRTTPEKRKLLENESPKVDEEAPKRPEVQSPAKEEAETQSPKKDADVKAHEFESPKAPVEGEAPNNEENQSQKEQEPEEPEPAAKTESEKKQESANEADEIPKPDFDQLLQSRESPKKPPEAEETPTKLSSAFSTPKRRVSKSPARRKETPVVHSDKPAEEGESGKAQNNEQPAEPVAEVVPRQAELLESPRGEKVHNSPEDYHTGRIILVKRDRGLPLRPTVPVAPEPVEAPEPKEPVEAPVEVKEAPPTPEPKKSPARRRVTRSPKRSPAKPKEEPPVERRSPRKARQSPARRRKVLPLEIGENVAVEKIGSTSSDVYDETMSSERSMDTMDALEAEINKLDVNRRQSIFDLQPSDDSSVGGRRRRQGQRTRDLMPVYARLTVSQRMRMLKTMKQKSEDIPPGRASQVRSLEDLASKAKKSDKKSPEQPRKIAFGGSPKLSLIDMDEPISVSVFEPSIDLDNWLSSDSDMSKLQQKAAGARRNDRDQGDSMFSLLDESTNFSSSDLRLASKEPEDTSSDIRSPLAGERSTSFQVGLVLDSDQGDTTQFSSGVAPFSTDSGVDYPMSNMLSMMRQKKDSDSSSSSDNEASSQPAMVTSDLVVEDPDRFEDFTYVPEQISPRIEQYVRQESIAGSGSD